MKKVVIVSACLIFFLASYSQSLSPDNVIKLVNKAQVKIKTAAYTVQRIDTFVTDDTRTTNGSAIVVKEDLDTLLGFKFWGKREADASERVYDGHIGYETNIEHKTYDLLNAPHELKYILLNGGGQLIVPELIKIDTTGVEKIQLTEDARHYYLTFYYPDLEKYDVEARRKIITIDKEMMLPVAVRSHQETYGKVQDLYWQIFNIQINQPVQYDFTDLPFLKDYSHVQPAEIKAPSLQLKNKIAPDFALAAFDGQNVSLSSFKGQVVLLDFWEVWCGPCIVSMPKVQALYDKYKSKGLVVYGIVNDQRNIQSTKEFVKKRSIKLPVLIGDEQFQRNYKFDGTVPLYVLINKKGEVSLVQFGFSEDIESSIREELN